MILFFLCNILIENFQIYSKNHPCKYRKTSNLKNTLEKGSKKPCITE